MTLDELNALPPATAEHAFRQCCTAERWIDAMVRERPFANQGALQAYAIEAWQQLEEPDFLQAFEGHPQIGNVDTLRARFANTKALAADEQSGVNVASEKTLKALAEGNKQYLEQNGFIFIVCASGKTADEMLTLLEERLQHSRDQELRIAVEQQSRITALRLDKLLDSGTEAIAKQNNNRSQA